jgi:hypothetical protein
MPPRWRRALHQYEQKGRPVSRTAHVYALKAAYGVVLGTALGAPDGAIAGGASMTVVSVVVVSVVVLSVAGGVQAAKARARITAAPVAKLSLRLLMIIPSRPITAPAKG